MVVSSMLRRIRLQWRRRPILRPRIGRGTQPHTSSKVRSTKHQRLIESPLTSCSSGSHISAKTPSVTDPPAVDSPPNVRQTTYVAKFLDNAHGICQMLTRKRLSCCIGHRPYSSLHGAHSSQPNAYATRNAICGMRATCLEMPCSSAMRATPLAYSEAFMFMEIWMQKTTPRICHFLHVGNEYPSLSQASVSVSSILSSEVMMRLVLSVFSCWRSAPSVVFGSRWVSGTDSMV